MNLAWHKEPGKIQGTAPRSHGCDGLERKSWQRLSTCLLHRGREAGLPSQISRNNVTGPFRNRLRANSLWRKAGMTFSPYFFMLHASLAILPWSLSCHKTSQDNTHGCESHCPHHRVLIAHLCTAPLGCAKGPSLRKWQCSPTAPADCWSHLVTGKEGQAGLPSAYLKSE